jgi:putative phage-type endonuclease
MLSNAKAAEVLGFNPATIEQGSDAWHICRLGLITASKVGAILTDPRSKADKEVGKMSDSAMTYMCELIAEIGTGLIPDEIKARPLMWGREHEASAREIFEFEHDVIVEQVSLIYKDESMRCGASPDGLCSDGRALEIKTPYTSSQFIKMAVGGIEEIKSQYHAQVNFQMYCADLSELWFVNFDPRMKKNNMTSHLVKRDDDVCEQFDIRIPKFISKMDESLEGLGFKFGQQWSK